MDGNHGDFYLNAVPPYNCSVDGSLGPYLILRNTQRKCK